MIAAIVDIALASGRGQAPWVGVLEEHPAIQYASRPTTDRVARVKQSLAQHALSRQSAEGAADRPFQRDEWTGHLMSVLDALGIPMESQLLVFRKPAFSAPTPARTILARSSSTSRRCRLHAGRAHRDRVPGSETGGDLLHGGSDGRRPGVCREQLSELSRVGEHVEVPGLIARSNIIAADGTPLPRLGSNDVNHGRLTLIDGAAGTSPPKRRSRYAQRAHGGNITFSPRGDTSNQVFTAGSTARPRRAAIRPQQRYRLAARVRSSVACDQVLSG